MQRKDEYPPVLYLSVKRAQAIASRHERDEDWDIWDDDEAGDIGRMTRAENVRRGMAEKIRRRL